MFCTDISRTSVTDSPAKSLILSTVTEKHLKNCDDDKCVRRLACDKQDNDDLLFRQLLPSNSQKDHD